MSRLISWRATCAVAVVLLTACTSNGVAAEQAKAAPDSVVAALRPILSALAGRDTSFQIDGRLEARIDGTPQVITLRLARHNVRAFDLEVTHADYSVAIRRRANITAMALPRHRRVYIGHGTVSTPDHLSPRGIAARLLTARTSVSLAAAFILSRPPEAVAGFVLATLGGKAASGTGLSTAKDGSLVIRTRDASLRLTHIAKPLPPEPADHWPGYQATRIPRDELERQLTRGTRRTLEVFWPSGILTSPTQQPRRVPHGELRWIEGQRVVLLHGTPGQVGTAHGQLLRSEAQACIDSVLHAFGTVQTIRTGRWFRHDLEGAYTRLSPHIPSRHKQETRSLAGSLQLDTQLVQALNVFPELFHCSGFALFGRATRDGKLYHGRVLDYMTTIGLQDAATTFVVKVDGRIPFANVGYAGFIGSVSGMNARGVSLGEMGGKGEGQWDGAPMSTLMRRALEECHTLEDVMRLWESSPRTCEYYYVFADGKTNRAVGVAATPDSIEWVYPGRSHPRLGEGIPDAIVLSAGNRLATLRQRVQSRYGQFDARLGKWLMSRPVAMESNLHNVLFVPADGIFYVANASHAKPAAERPYVKFNLHDLLRSMQPATSKDTAAR